MGDSCCVRIYDWTHSWFDMQTNRWCCIGNALYVKRPLQSTTLVACLNLKQNMLTREISTSIALPYNSTSLSWKNMRMIYAHSKGCVSKINTDAVCKRLW